MIYTIRESHPDDAPALVQLAKLTGFGFTTLTPDRHRIDKRLAESQAGDAPLLVMHHTPSGQLVGTSGLVTRVGDADQALPFYAYRVEHSVRQSKTLGIRHDLTTLHLHQDFNGPTEVGTLFLNPDHRGQGRGRALSLSRFMLLALRPQHFSNQVIAELRGVVDSHGHSPFWEAVGRHFFGLAYPQADELSYRDKRFIAELLPDTPISTKLLPPAAQRVIGKVHPDSQGALRLLESEGFHPANMVDIFDAGPCFRCDRDAIRTVRQARPLHVELTDTLPPRNTVPQCVATDHDGFRCLAGPYAITTHTLQLPPADAAFLRLETGNAALVSPLTNSKPKTSAPAAARAITQPSLP
ncbi:MAG: arginine N-succinyltransferase [Planctomycetota bacterium]